MNYNRERKSPIGSLICVIVILIVCVWYLPIYKVSTPSKKEKAQYIEQINKLDNVLPRKNLYIVEEKEFAPTLKKIGYSSRSVYLCDSVMKDTNGVSKGFKIHGNIFIIIDHIDSKEELCSTYFHERQHYINEKHQNWIKAIKSEYKREELLCYVESFRGGPFYKSMNSSMLTDELIAFVIGEAYAKNKSIEKVCKSHKINNRKVIDKLSEIYAYNYIDLPK